MKLIRLLFIFFLIPFANAGILIDSTLNQPNQAYYINNTNFHSLATQFIINVPYQVLDGTNYIDAITLKLGTITNKPNQDLVFRIYRTTNNNYINSFSVIDNYHINYSYISDYAGEYKLNFDAPLYFNPANNEGISIGIYSTTTTGSYYIFGRSDTFITFINHNTYYTHVLDVYGQSVYGNEGLDNNTVLFNTAYVKLYGSLIFPTTPIPTPLQIGNGSNELPCYDCNGTIPNSNDGSNTSWIPSFNDSTIPCPECIGNETVNPYDNIPSGSTSEGFLKGLGYCNTLGCNLFDIINFLYDITFFMMYLSFAVIIGKWYFVWRKS